MHTRLPALSRHSLTTLLLFAAACAGEESAEPAEEMAEPAGEMAEPAGEMAQEAAGTAPTCWVRGDVADRASPLDSATVELDGATVKVCYGAPSARDRTVMGGLVPYDQPWRAGANEATALHVTAPVTFGSVRLEPGSYALYTVPGESEWRMVLQDEHERWGIPIPQDADLGAVTATPEETPEMVESLTYRFEDEGAGQAALVLEWENTRVAVPIRAAGGM